MKYNISAFLVAALAVAIPACATYTVLEGSDGDAGNHTDEESTPSSDEPAEDGGSGAGDGDFVCSEGDSGSDFSDSSDNDGDSDINHLYWATSAGGMDRDYGHDLSPLSDGAVLVTGYFCGTATFGEGEAAETVFESAGESDAFIARYSSDGTLAWARQAGGPGPDSGNGISALPDGSSIVIGKYYEYAVFSANNPNETLLTARGFADVFIAKYDPEGTLVWVRSAGGGSDDTGRDVSTLPDGTSVITGSIYGGIFGVGEPNETYLLGFGRADIFLAKYGSDGRLQWAVRAGGDQDESSTSVSTTSNDSILLTGYLASSATFGPGEPNETTLTPGANKRSSFLALYNPDGTLAWAIQAVEAESVIANSVSTLQGNAAVLIGNFYGSAVFGAGEVNEKTLHSQGLGDVFVAKYNATGTIEWATSAGGSSADEGLSAFPLPDGSSLATGYFQDNALFGDGENNETFLLSAGSWDAFLARYGPDGTLVWARRVGGPGDDRGRGISAIPYHSVFLTGSFERTATFPLGDSEERSITSAGGKDIFLLKQKF